MSSCLMTGLHDMDGCARESVVVDPLRVLVNPLLAALRPSRRSLSTPALA